MDYDDNSSPLAGPFVAAIAWLAVYIFGIGTLAFKVLSKPTRRRERCRFLVDLLEMGFQNGCGPEKTFVEATETLDLSLPHEFFEAATQIRGGATLSEALRSIPSEIPTQLAEMIRVGEEIGDVRKVLPACRELFNGAESETRAGFDFMVIGNLILLPTIPVLVAVLRSLIVPRFLEMSTAFGGSTPASLIFLLDHSVLACTLQTGFAAILLGWFILRIWNPKTRRAKRVVPAGALISPPFWKTSTWNYVKWMVSLLCEPISSFRDGIMAAVPWTRRRLQRDFCAMLSLLLDAGVAESKAVALAAESTANVVFIRRATRALEDLSAGKNLEAALRRFDKAGEFSWRLKNAVGNPGGFNSALAGWIESLEAKAFQQEQTASQVTTTGLVLCNGLVVGVIATAMFGMLVSFMQ